MREMKKQAYIKTGSLPAKKVNRKRISDRIKRKRQDGHKFKRVMFKDAIGYQSDDKYDPYIYARLI